MKEVLIFAGTTEGRKLSEYLSQAEIRHTACVATEYGEIVLEGSPFMKVHKGRMDEGEIKEFLRAGDYEDRCHASLCTGRYPELEKGSRRM